jgi:sulfur-carrier protein
MKPDSDTTIRIKVRVYAGLRRHLPHLGLGESEVMEISSGLTVGELLDRLGVSHSEAKSCFVNNRKQELDHRLQDGDEVAVFPPIGGGACRGPYDCSL